MKKHEKKLLKERREGRSEEKKLMIKGMKEGARVGWGGRFYGM